MWRTFEDPEYYQEGDASWDEHYDDDDIYEDELNA